MSYENVGKLMDKWMNDPNFRADVKKDPEGAVLKTGANLSPDEWAALKNFDWNANDEELKSRVSKAFG